MRVPQRSTGAAGLVRLMIAVIGVTAIAAAVLTVPEPATGNTAEPRVAGVHGQVSVDGRYVGQGLENVGHALTAFAAIHKVTGDPRHRQVFEALLDRLLAARPSYMGALLGVQVLDDPYLLSHPRLVSNLHGFADRLIDTYARDPGRLLHRGGIRTLTGNASFLVAYAEYLHDGEAAPADIATLATRIRKVDEVAVALLDRLVELQFTVAEATDRFNNPRFAGAFPHLVDAGDGSMGSWDVANWSPAMLSIEQYSAVRALAEGFGRFHRAMYGRAAAAAARPLLGTDRIDPELIYAGSPPGFALDGAEFVIGEESGEHLYLVTYGWSPNAIGDLGTALRALIDNRVTVPRSAEWARLYWRGGPPASVLDPVTFWQGLSAKVAYTHHFMKATQLPVPADFPWIDLDRTSFPGTGDDDIRRGGWYDGSGRGAMSAVYSRIAINGYVASGGDDIALLNRAGQWWEKMIIWE